MSGAPPRVALDSRRSLDAILIPFEESAFDLLALDEAL